MGEDQHTIMMKAFRLLLDKQSRAARRRQTTKKLGTINHIKKSADTLSPQEMKIYKTGKAETQEELQAMVSKNCKPVDIHYLVPSVRGKTYEKKLGSKEILRAAKRKGLEGVV